jgi:hypothetical protein
VTLARVTDGRLNTPFRVNFRVVTWPRNSPNGPGKTVASDVLTIPAWKQATSLKIDLKPFLDGGDVDRVTVEIDSLSEVYYTTTPHCTLSLTTIEAERAKRGLDKPSDPAQPLQTSQAQGFAFTVRLSGEVKRAQLKSAAGLEIPLTNTVQDNEHTFKPVLALSAGYYELTLKTKAETLKFSVLVK